MYLSNEELQGRITQIAAAAAEKSGGVVVYEEQVALPAFGQIVLRFDLKRDTVSLCELDAWEAMLNELAGAAFLVDFMGSVYQKAGVDYTRLDARCRNLAAELSAEAVTASVHAPGLAADAAELLTLAGLDSTQQVWEIQPDGDRWLLLILGRQNRKIKEIDAFVHLTVGEVDETPCLGLVKATFAARRQKRSLARFLLGER